MGYEKLFEPINIGPVEINNRLALAPMNPCLDDSGYISDATLAYYAERARGGVGLIITSATLGGKLASKYRAHYANPMLYDSTHLKGHYELVEMVHSYGVKVFIQLYPGPGRTGNAPSGVQCIAPSALPYFRDPQTWPKPYKTVMTRWPSFLEKAMGVIPREITIEEILQIEDEFAEAAWLATIAGYDGIEIHLAHGYLMHQFLSPRSNKRTDLYGGSLENRMRFHVELVGKTLNRIRKEIPDYPIGIRMSTQEHQPDGFSFEEAETLLKRLVEDGISFYDVSTASHENYVTMFPDRDGTMLKDAARMRKSLGIPVITPGIHKPENAVKAVEDGQTDMIGLARAALADPDWANKVRQDKVNQIRKCARDYLCLINILMGLPVRCSVNPDMGRERWKSGVVGPDVPKGEKIVARVLRRNRWDRKND
jgi:2-enoate reductase